MSITPPASISGTPARTRSPGISMEIDEAPRARAAKVDGDGDVDVHFDDSDDTSVSEGSDTAMDADADADADADDVDADDDAGAAAAAAAAAEVPVDRDEAAPTDSKRKPPMKRTGTMTDGFGDEEHVARWNKDLGDVFAPTKA